MISSLYYDPPDKEDLPLIKYLKTDDAKCVGCMNCTADCSVKYFKEDNPALSCIAVQGLGKSAFHLVACDQECRKCAAECPTKAISVTSAGVVVINKGLCVGCLACVAVCPIEAMLWYPGGKTPFKCIACGSCVKKCPKEALSIVEKEESPESRWPFEVEAAVNRSGTRGAAK
jgi:Fe-S-cluster-containing dehydrogenase component